MAKDNDRYVVNHPDGWAVRSPHSDRASDVFDTQKEAINRAKEIVSNLGGGEVHIQGRDWSVARFRYRAAGERSVSPAGPEALRRFFQERWLLPRVMCPAGDMKSSEWSL